MSKHVFEYYKDHRFKITKSVYDVLKERKLLNKKHSYLVFSEDLNSMIYCEKTHKLRQIPVKLSHEWSKKLFGVKQVDTYRFYVCDLDDGITYKIGAKICCEVNCIKHITHYLITPKIFNKYKEIKKVKQYFCTIDDKQLIFEHDTILSSHNYIFLKQNEKYFNNRFITFKCGKFILKHDVYLINDKEILEATLYSDLSIAISSPLSDQTIEKIINSKKSIKHHLSKYSWFKKFQSKKLLELNC